MVHVPSVKGLPLRDVPVTYGEDRATCPVRCRQAWLKAKLATDAVPGGQATTSGATWATLDCPQSTSVLVVGSASTSAVR